MTVQPGPHEVRRLVLQALEELGASVPGLADLEETILIDDGRYTARSYRVEGYMTMWRLRTHSLAAVMPPSSPALIL